jgi:predicted restriction endonuclease
MAMKCCHLYEIKAHEALTTVAERKDKLKSLKLVDINELRNLVTMCEKCHTRFDSHQIGIHPVDRRWIITDTLRGIDAPSLTPYKDIHGRAVVFTIDTYEPPLEVLEDRFVPFLEKNKHKTAKKTVHYCHFCLESFSGASGLADKGEHVKLCRVTTLTRKLTRKRKRLV